MRKAWKVLLAAVLCPFLALVLNDLLTVDTVPYWINAILGFVGFLGAATIAARIAGKLTGIALSIGLGVPWGVAALIELPPLAVTQDCQH